METNFFILLSKISLKNFFFVYALNFFLVYDNLFLLGIDVCISFYKRPLNIYVYEFCFWVLILFEKEEEKTLPRVYSRAFWG